jgi:hypothetical protein
VLTSIASYWRGAWEDFVGAHFSYLPADIEALRVWCAQVMKPKTASLDERRFDRQHDAI